MLSPERKESGGPPLISGLHEKFEGKKEPI